jgi:hypothetical protein
MSVGIGDPPDESAGVAEDEHQIDPFCRHVGDRSCDREAHFAARDHATPAFRRREDAAALVRRHRLDVRPVVPVGSEAPLPFRLCSHHDTGNGLIPSVQHTNPHEV